MSTWIKLENFMCPVSNCPSKRAITWVCSVDNDPMFLNERGVISCLTGAHTGLMSTWNWNCGNIYHRGGFLPGDSEGFIYSYSQAVQLMRYGGSAWVASLMSALGNQYGF